MLQLSKTQKKQKTKIQRQKENTRFHRCRRNKLKELDHTKNICIPRTSLGLRDLMGCTLRDMIRDANNNIIVCAVIT